MRKINPYFSFAPLLNSVIVNVPKTFLTFLSMEIKKVSKL